MPVLEHQPNPRPFPTALASMTTTSELQLLTMMAHHGNMSVIVVDREAHITQIIGEIAPYDNGIDKNTVIGQSIDSFFRENPKHAKRYHEALENRPSTVVLQTEWGVFAEIQVLPLFDTQNNVIGAFGFKYDVTDREKAIRQSQDQEDQLRKLLEHSEDGIYLLDRNYVIQRTNSVATAAYGAEGPLVGQVCYQRIFGRSEPCNFCPVIKTFQTGLPEASQYFDEILQKHLQYNASPLLDPQTGELIGAFLTFRDISDRIKLKIATETHESFVADIFASIQDGMFIVDREYTILKTNPAFEQMYPEHLPLTGKKCFLTSNRDQVCGHCPVAEMFETGRTTQAVYYEQRAQMATGEWHEHKAHPIFAPTGEIVAAICVIRNITRQKEQEETLAQYRIKLEQLVDKRTQDWEQSELRIQAIISGGSVPIAFADPDGSLMFANAAFQTLTGYSKQEWLGKTLLQATIYDEHTLNDHDFMQKREAFYTEAIDQFSHDICIRQKDGTKRWVDFTASIVKDLEGKRIQVLFILLDITDRYQMEQAVREVNERAQIMLDSTPLCCNLWDEHFNIIDCNREAVKLFGMKDKQEYLNRFYELSPEYQPDGQPSQKKFAEQFIKAFREGYCQFEWMHRKPDGSLIPAEVTLIYVKRGEKHIVASYIRDLREQKQMLARMREADERTQIMLDATPLCCNLWDEHFNNIDCNLEAVKLFGLRDKREYLFRFYDLLPEEQPDGSSSREKLNDYILAAFRDGYCRFEWTYQKLDGTPIPAEVTLVCVKRGKGFIVASYTRDMREYKQMLAKMREADEYTQIMLDATPLCCHLWSDHYNIIACNLATVKLYELNNKQEFLDRFYELSPKYQPDGQLSADKASECIAKAFRDGYHRFEWMHQKLDGTPMPAEVTLVRVQQGNDHIVAGYIRDLREHKQMLAKMREADERIQIMLDATPLCCSLWDDQLNLLDCNMETVKLYGLRNKQEYIDRFFELSPTYQPDGRLSAASAGAHLTVAFRDGYHLFEWMHHKLDGTPIPTEVTLVRVQRGSGHIVAGYTRDLREIKKHEALQERDQQRTNALLELAQMAENPESEIADYVIKSVISLTESAMGYVVLLEHIHDALPFSSLILDPSFRCPLPPAMDKGMPHALSNVLMECITTKKAVIHNDFASLPGKRTFPAGHIDVYSHVNLPIMDGEKPIGILGVGNKSTPYTETDVKHLTLLTQGFGNLLSRKKYAESLEKAKNDAESANKAKSDFLAHMSHEIRTPLNGVIGLSDLLTGTPLNDKQREYVQLINDSGKSLLFLINDILDFSKIEAGKLEIYPEPFDLPATIGSVLAALVSRADEKKLALAVSLCQNLPHIVLGDSGRIRQILLNLTGNAVKFTDQGGVRIDVTLESVAEESLTVKFSVIDTGIGISQSGIERLFKAFSQVDSSAARVYGGTGLGLAISMRLVQLMKGEIGVESAEGQGSTFWFTVPLGCDHQVIKCIQKKECRERHCPNADGSICTVLVNREVRSEYSIEGRPVLIVDDNEVHRDALQIQLRNWAMECTVCDSAEEALRLSQERCQRGEPFELFVIDNTLAGRAGVDLTHQLFVQEKQIHNTKVAQAILLRSLSDNSEPNDLENVRTESVSKPVLPSALFNAVMNRVYALERQKGVDSGVIDPGELGSQAVTKPKIRKSLKPGIQPGLADRLKSSLAGKVHILVVEDNRVNQIVAKNILAEAGFTCDIASDGNEACSAVRNKEYDIVLMDCQMPEMDGYEATGLIRNWEREQGKKRLPIIALTANAVKDDVQKCFDVGMDAYCSKPISAVTMINLIEEWYEKAKK